MMNETVSESEAMTNASQFSHAMEGAFAQILDFYGIPWTYEPRTFPLEWDARGNVIEAFTPDFYLPDQDLFIELTTLRPKLSTFKNRKLKRMSELYPEIQIKLLKRRDLRQLMAKFGLDEGTDYLYGTDAQRREDAR